MGVKITLYTVTVCPCSAPLFVTAKLHVTVVIIPMSKYKLMLCSSKMFILSLLFFFIIEANNLIILNYTHNDILKERRFFVSNFDIDFNFMVFFDSTVRYGESP